MGESLLDRKTREAGGPAALVRAIGPANVNRLVQSWRAVARPEQLPPAGDWSVWFIQAGRFWGKTRTGAEWTNQLARRAAQWIRDGIIRPEEAEIHLVGATAADVRDVMVRGPAGIMRCSTRDFQPVYKPSSRRIDWPGGAFALLFSGQEPERLRGPQGIGCWADELPAWQYPEDTWDNLQFGLRLGRNPQTVVTTTPRPIKLVKDLLKERGTVVTRGRSSDNAKNVSAQAIARLYDKYGGTRLGRQELDGDLLDDNPGALWKLGDIERLRIRMPPNFPVPANQREALWQDRDADTPPAAAIIRDIRRRAAWAKLVLHAHGIQIERVVIACDPSGSNNQNSDECGIVVGAAAICNCRGTPERHGFVLDDLTGVYSPSEWGAVLVAAYNAFTADRIVAETNYGGALVEANLRGADGGANLPYSGVHVRKGKALRAEPVSGLTEQGKEHHVGCFAKLEDELTQWDPLDPTARSPNRLDAKVYALTELIIEGGTASFGDLPTSGYGWRRRGG